MKIRANNIDIEVVDSAPDAPQLPVVLLIMGLGMQLIAWPPGMVHALINAGYRVIRFDNRDSGLSDKFDALGMPNLLWQGMKYKRSVSGLESKLRLPDAYRIRPDSRSTKIKTSATAL